MTLASQWIVSDAVAALNLAAQQQGTEARWSLVQGLSQYPSVGIFLPGLHTVVNRQCPAFDRVHFALGFERWNRRNEKFEFDLGTETSKPIYIGIRIHRGAQTITKSLHREIYEASVDRLRRATSPELEWRPRDKFWSVWSYIPTSRDGQLLSAEDYTAFVVEQALKGHEAIKDLWSPGADTTESHEFDRFPPTVSPRPRLASGARPQWEYHTLEVVDIIALNALGADGWEVVGMTGTETGLGVLLKRQRS